MSKRITSLDNKEIKNIIRLTNKSRLRNESKLFVVEGLRELRMANSNGFNIKKLFCNTNIANLKSCLNIQYTCVRKSARLNRFKDIYHFKRVEDIFLIIIYFSRRK